MGRRVTRGALSLAVCVALVGVAQAAVSPGPPAKWRRSDAIIGSDAITGSDRTKARRGDAISGSDAIIGSDAITGSDRTKARRGDAISGSDAIIGSDAITGSDSRKNHADVIVGLDPH